MATSSTSQLVSKSLYTGYDDPKELGYICSIDNVSSVMENGLLPLEKVNRLGMQLFDPSNSEVKERRTNNKDNINHYVNLYLQPYNRILYRIYEQNKNICVLRVHPKILKKDGCLIADRNPSSPGVKFKEVKKFTFDQASSHILHCKESMIFSNELRKNYGIQIDENLARQIREAAVLVSSKIPSTYVKGIYVPNEEIKKNVEKSFNYPKKVIIHPSLFFEDGRRYHQLDEIDAPLLSDIDEGDLDSDMIHLKDSVESLTSQKQKTDPFILSPLNRHVKIIKKGDLFKSNMQTLVNPVNCVGIMGKGIALSFKERFPEMFSDYSNRCKDGKVQIGEPYLFNLKNGKKIINFPTKNHWRGHSKIASIEQGLQYLVENISNWEIESLATTLLGCGNGKLNATDVQKLLLKYFSPLNITVEIYVP